MPITILAGHYGSGKTQIAVNLALMHRRHTQNVLLCDLDIVNPYFRTADAAAVLAGAGVRLISSDYAGSNVEMPGLPPEALAMFDQPDAASVLDVGGDDRGALVLGRYAGKWPEDTKVWLVINACRPLTRTAAQAEQIAREVESAGRVRFTGIINNTNLGAATTAADIEHSFPYAREVSELLALPVLYTCVQDRLMETIDTTHWPWPARSIHIYAKEAWRIEEVNPHGKSDIPRGSL